MKTYIITNTNKASKAHFHIRASSEEEALQKVFDHMGMDCYKVTDIV